MAMSNISLNNRIIAFGCDHAGFVLQQRLMDKLKGLGFTVINCGTHDESSVDYPDFAKQVVDKVLHRQAEKGVLVCGSGIGMCIAANRHRGIRAACCYDGGQAMTARQHNDINILCLGSRISDEDMAFDCLVAFLQTEFEGERHQRRLDKIDSAYAPSE